MEWSDVTAHLTGVAGLATATPDGVPHIATVAPVLDGEVLWIFTRATSTKARRIATNPPVALTWRPAAEAYVYGEASLVTDLDEKRRLWARPDLPFDPAGFFGSVDHPDHVLVRVVPTRAIVMTHGPDGPQRLRWSAG